MIEDCLCLLRPSPDVCKDCFKRSTSMSTSDSDPRIINLTGSPYNRGRQYGLSQGSKIKHYYQSKCHEFSHLTKEWKRMASKQMEVMKKHCPVTFEEMRGTASVDDPDLTLELLMQLTIFPEVEAFDHFHPFRCDDCAEVIESAPFMKCIPCELDFCRGCGSGHHHALTESDNKGNENHSAGKKCTSFVRAEPNDYLVGQTDEENPPYNQHGLLHVIQRVTDEDNMQSLLYTAPGTPCMAGMNSHGLCVLANTLFVPDNRFWDGVPTLAATRELLTKTTLPDAVEYIRSLPLAIPLNFVIAQCGFGIANLEASHVDVQNIKTDEATGAVYVHCNHCQSPSFVSREELPVPPISTKQRQHVMEACVKKSHQNGTPMDLQWLKSTMLKPPINNSFVIGTIIMEPQLGLLHVRFGIPTCSRKKRQKRQKGIVGSPIDGITDWRQMETARSLLPGYNSYGYIKKI